MSGLALAGFQAAVSRARDCVQACRFWQPQVAIVLGSGLGLLASHVQHASTIDYDHIPFFPPTTASGHAGKLVLGYLGGMPVVIMQGRGHRYEGLADHQISFPIHCLHALGAKTLITTNAAGGLNARYRRGDLMLIDEHINFLWPRGQVERLPGTQPAHCASPYDLQLMQRAHRIARRLDIDLRQGCYLATLGPTYETRSEYRFFRLLGADAVGMSTVPEVLAARDLGMRVLAASIITNVASTDTPLSTSHAEVVDTGQQAGPRLLQIITQLLEDMAGQPD